ncbi:hypothetical protein J7T55_003158 [Diaporthe amygdali]|uniref:uncharacterized protein n=1 Tax=Phomopsis amygdali TaxID=1214568 RepID=UPI0022FE0236|nr:uncharacterized protein J7T55_003158 [Diaporthe amygdali]KAJ0122643.1 hypothetical protein J7T55_003158 [Diaporthe amygdali]
MCDATKPFCRACLRLGLECAGYARSRLRFKDETVRYLGKPPAQVTRVSNRNEQLAKMIPIRNTIPLSPSHSPQDLAVSFFLTYVTDVGRSLESTRGFLEFVRPALASEKPSSALFAAVNAVALKVWTTMGHNNVSDSLAIQSLGQALVRLHQATNDPEERTHDATVLAALVLQMHDTLSAVSGQAKAMATHRHGAFALLSQRDDNTHGSKFHAYLVGNLLHARVSRSVKTNNTLSSTELKWLKTHVMPVLPMNPSSLLDVIGVDIAGLQHDFCSPSLAPHTRPPRLRELRERVQRLDVRLQRWIKSIPPLWYPRRMQSRNGIDPSIETYHGACDIYPSMQIVNIWNTWRIYRLILEQAKSRLITLLDFSWNELSSTQNDINPGDVTRQVQELVDSICFSIPFYLGSCTRSGILANMENPHNKFPSYHDLSPSDEAFLEYTMSDHYVSRFDHSRHVNLHGPLHIVSILSQLIGLLVRERNSNEVYSLQQDQERWIAGHTALKEPLTQSQCSMNGIMTPVGACDTTQISGCGRQKANEIIHEAEPSRPEPTPTIFDRSARL